MAGSAGNEHLVEDRLDPARSAALWAALDLPGEAPAPGDPLPPFFHQVYFWDPHPPSALGPDGHAALGGVIPDLDSPRRMWAGSRLTFHTPLLTGVRATKTTQVLATTRKTGRSGPLAFLTLRHSIRQRSTLAITEDQDLVYRASDAPPGQPTEAPRNCEQSEIRQFDPILLFRYSALTFNGHRIHYDADYARDREGYPGLVVHGPLLAQFLMLFAERACGSLESFAFRATAPICLPETATICRSGATLWVAGEDGRQCMIAEAA
jgi:3-methylfumaryl-CoA hydratase